MSLFINNVAPTGAAVAAALAAVLPAGALSFANSATPTSPTAPGSDIRVTAKSEIEAGRYLARIGACHDCHTPGYDQHGFDVPEESLLAGSPVGWRGPWGTTYPSNLRIFASETPRDVWLTVCRERSTRPPMPWVNLHAMSDEDLLAIHSYLVHLGPVGERMPEYCAPTAEPSTPFYLLDPDELATRPVYAECPETGLVPAHSVESFDLRGISIDVLVPSTITRDAYTLIEEVLPAGTGTPAQRLARYDVVLLPVEGELLVRIDDTQHRVGPGDRMALPRGTLHALRNTGERAVRVHVLASPGGYDDFLAAMADLSPTAPEDEITSLLSSHGVHLQPSSTQ